MAFDGFGPAHFDAYSPEKWSSNVYNLNRMKVKDVMGSLATQVMIEASDSVSGLLRGVSDEVPNIINQKKVDAQWVYWFRPADAQKELASLLRQMKLNASALLNAAVHDQHTILAMAFRREALSLSVHLSPGAKVDRRNLAAKLEKSWHRESLAELSQNTVMGFDVVHGERRIPVESADASFWAGLSTQLGPDDPSLSIERSFLQSELLNLDAEAIVNTVATHLAALRPFYNWMAWSKDNDNIDVNKHIQEEKSAKRRQFQNFKSGDEVRITAGFFSGQKGKIEEIDTRGRLKVRVGGASVQVKGDQVAPA